jgi:hypothetical protein
VPVSAERRAEYDAYLRSPAWRTRRLVALESAGSRCQVCNGSGRLCVHHRTYERFGYEDPGDLTVLCARCHDLFHRHGHLAKGPPAKAMPVKREVKRHRQERVDRILAVFDVGEVLPTDEIARRAKLADGPAGTTLAHMRSLNLVERPLRGGPWRRLDNT